MNLTPTGRVFLLKTQYPEEGELAFKTPLTIETELRGSVTGVENFINACTFPVSRAFISPVVEGKELKWSVAYAGNLIFKELETLEEGEKVIICYHLFGNDKEYYLIGVEFIVGKPKKLGPLFDEE